MQKHLRQNIVRGLWERYRLASPDMQRIAAVLKEKNIAHAALDHFAVIDLPGPHSGIPQLYEIFSALGYVERGKDYLAAKQNDFLWMAEGDCMRQPAEFALPQVVIADFRLDEMPSEIRNIIYHYSCKTDSTAAAEIVKLIQQPDALPLCTQKALHYFAGRDWPAPLVKEFHAVREFNELLAWVLVFGRRPNHFTLSVHLLNHFPDLQAFHRFVEEEVKLPLNHEGGSLKGGAHVGIAQGSTAGISQRILLADGEIEIPTGFVEFVWRYSEKPAGRVWEDYFTHFIGQQADRVIESLYVE
jgi:hypothetical protein